MRTYNQDNYFETILKGLPDIILSSSIYYSFIMSLISLIPVTIFKTINLEEKENYKFALNTVFGLYTFFLGTFLSFRLNSSFNSWSSGVSNIGSLVYETKKNITILRSLSSKAMTFNNVTNIDNYNVIKNNLLLFVAHIFNMCTHSSYKKKVKDFDIRPPIINDDEINKLRDYNIEINSFSDSQMDKLKTIYNYTNLNLCTDKESQILETTFYNSYVFTELLDTLSKQLVSYSYEIGLHVSESNMLLNNLYNIANVYNKLYSMVNIPVVYIYNQLVNISIFIYILFFILIIEDTSEWYTPIWTFAISINIFTANFVSNSIDNPFGDDKDDLELEIIFNSLITEIEAIEKNIQI
jgi:predicted membrane chloride channel (bestrophin family)